MIIQVIPTGYEYEAELTTNHSASSYGLPVIVEVRTGEAVDELSLAISGIVEATDEERAALEAAGYPGLALRRIAHIGQQCC